MGQFLTVRRDRDGRPAPSAVSAWVVANVNVKAATPVTTNVPLLAPFANPDVVIFWPTVNPAAMNEPDDRVIVSGFELTAA